MAKKSMLMNLSTELYATNPFEALLPEDRLKRLQALPVAKRQEFYGRVVDSVFSDPGYQSLVSNVAVREFDRLTGGDDVRSVGDIRSVVEDVVTQVLRARGM